MRVLVCGGRDFDNAALVEKTLCDLRPAPSVIIHGAASGADRLAGMWANHYGTDERRFPADWRRFGKSAGPYRNRQMLMEGQPDLVIAFPRLNGEWGAGTRNMISEARKAGVEVREVIA